MSRAILDAVLKLEIQKVVVAVGMEAYAAPLIGKSLHVWVNPPQKKLDAIRDIILAVQTPKVKNANQAPFPKAAYDLVHRFLKPKTDRALAALDRRLLEWYADIWSEGPADTRWSVEELRVLETQAPAFLSWMVAQTWMARSDHIEAKNNSARPAPESANA